jgi:hypothetical protein
VLKYHPEPEVRFLWGLTGAGPPPTPLPGSIRILLELRGLVTRPLSRKNFSKFDFLPDWRRLLAGCPRAREWWASPTALHVPRNWPPEVAAALPEAVTPLTWVLNCPPKDRSLPRGLKTWCPPGTDALAAAAFGFPLTDTEVQRARAAATDLMCVPNFLIWAYDLDLDTLPLPSEPKVSLERKLKARRDLQDNPLGYGTSACREGLPKSVVEDPWKLLLTCKKSGLRPRKTTRWLWQRVFTPSNAERLRKEGRLPIEGGVQTLLEHDILRQQRDGRLRPRPVR